MSNKDLLDKAAKDYNEGNPFLSVPYKENCYDT